MRESRRTEKVRVRVWLAAIDEPEMREVVIDAWRMVVPKRVAVVYDRGGQRE